MKQKMRGKFLSIVVMVAMTVLLMSCGSDKSGSSGDGITLEFQQWWGVELPDNALADICQKFTDKTGIKIELLSNPYTDTKTQIAVGAASGTMADVVGLDGAWVYDFAKQGSIANLTELMKNSGYDASQLSDQIQFEENTYMIPVVNFAYPMYANMDILNAAGVTKLPKTRMEFLAACKAVRAYDNNIAGWLIPLSTEAPNGIQGQFMSWLWASGGSMLKNGKPNLVGNPAMDETVNFVKEMYDAGVLGAGAYSMKEADMVEEFANGRSAFMISGVSHLNLIKKEAPNIELDLIKVPVVEGYTGENGMFVASWGIGISENSKNKEAAMKFVEYMMSPEVNAELSVLANAFPGNLKAKPDYSKSSELFKKAFDLFQKSYAVGGFTGLPISEDLMRSFDEQLQLYLDGDTATVEDMLKVAQEKWDIAFE